MRGSIVFGYLSTERGVAKIELLCNGFKQLHIPFLELCHRAAGGTNSQRKTGSKYPVRVNSPRDADSVINNGPCLFWESVAFHTAVDDVYSLCASNQTLDETVLEDDRLELLQSSVRFSRLLNQLAERLGNILCMLPDALKSRVYWLCTTLFPVITITNFSTRRHFMTYQMHLERISLKVNEQGG